MEVVECVKEANNEGSFLRCVCSRDINATTLAVRQPAISHSHCLSRDHVASMSTLRAKNNPMATTATERVLSSPELALKSSTGWSLTATQDLNRINLAVSP